MFMQWPEGNILGKTENEPLQIPGDAFLVHFILCGFLIFSTRALTQPLIT